MEVLGLTQIVLGLTVGVVMGWLISRALSVSASKVVEEELIRTKAILELGDKTNEKVREQMLDGFRLAAGEAFSHAIEEADREKESSFKEATSALSESMNMYIEAIQKAKEKDIERSATLGEKVDNVSALGTALADETRELALALRGDSQSQGAWGEVVVENLLQNMVMNMYKF